MDEKLNAYRANKKREELIKSAKEGIVGLFRRKHNKMDENNSKIILEADENEELLSNHEDCDNISEISTDEITCCNYSDMIYYVLCFILWATLYAIFIKLEFGIIYFIVSSMVIMYLNTGTRKKKSNEISAYSVFNKDCKSIDGTLNAEQLQQQMIYGRLT